MPVRSASWFLSALLCASCTGLKPSGPGSQAMDEAGIVTDEAGMVADEAGIVTDEAGIATDEAGIIGGGVGPSPSGGESDSGVMEACSVAGELRCAVRAGQRERCAAGFWAAAEPCANGEICANQPAPATCQAVAAICRGSVDQAVCDGQGIMYQCNAQGVATSQETCSSTQTCQMGIASRKCLACIPGSFKCTGTSLERCNTEGTAYAMHKTCATAALCNTSVGDCTQMACLPNGHTCQGDMLRRCNANQTAYEDVKPCKPGLCDQRNGQCDECTPSATGCEMNTATGCSADGQTVTRMVCPAATPRCVGVGRCVQCASDADCADPGVCKTRHCNLATGMCEPQNQTARTPCTGGLCDGSGSCRGCLQNADCPDPGDCKTAYCDPSTRACAPRNVASGTSCRASAGYCNGSGSCAQCTLDSQCSAPVCRVARCSAGQCTVATMATGTRDARCPSNQVCDSTSACVECTATSHCDPLEVCEAGRCVDSCPNGNLDVAAGETCEVGLNGRDDWSCNRDTCKLTGLTGSTLGKDCTNRSCSTGEVCDQSLSFGYPMCLPSCGSSSTCSLPPGWTGLCTSASPGQRGCIVQCQAGRCPNLSTCNMPGSGTGWCQ